MSDSDLPGTSDEHPSAPEQPSAEPTRPYDDLPTSPQAEALPPTEQTSEQTSALPPLAPPPPPAYPSPYGGQQSGGYGQPAAPYYGYQQAPYGAPPHGQHLERRSHVPGWLWPVVAAVALVVGLLGGAIGGALVANGDDVGGTPESVGVLGVERRTAPPLPADNKSIPKVAEQVLPSTVKIVAEFQGRAGGAAGSGWVFDKQGHVITNNHVVAEAAADDGPIDVIDHKGAHHRATVVGRSPVYDLAVLKVEGIEDLPPAAVGSSDQMRVGETVVAVGSPLALSASVTSGIISALNRPVTTGNGDDTSFINAIQTDAAINPGNSGGPLANIQGQVIGVNSALATLGSSEEEGTNIGIGFAIPIEQVQVTADQILRTGKAQYPVIGVTVKGSAKVEGAEVTEITTGTPAARSDLRVGDVITAVDGRPVTDQTDVVVAIRSHLVTDEVELTVRRGSKTLKVTVGLLAKTG